MIRSEPHPLSVFSLVPLNERSSRALDHPKNQPHVSYLPDYNDDAYPSERGRGLNIGFNIESSSPCTLATIGREGDIIVSGSAISRIQCSFEVVQSTGMFRLTDRSRHHNTQFKGLDAVPFEPGRTPRRAVIHAIFNTEFAFGGSNSNLYHFRIHWHRVHFDIRRQIDSRGSDHCLTISDTSGEEDTALGPERFTRIHTPQFPKLRYRYRTNYPLGRGTFGEVFEGVNVDTGELLAVKNVTLPDTPKHGTAYKSLKIEVENIGSIKHENIIRYLWTEWKSMHMFIIVMPRMQGSVARLMDDGAFITDHNLTAELLHQMLKALDLLALRGLIHRDVKPENILYLTAPDRSYNFKLADFGLCNYATRATTRAGTPPYMAPEVLINGRVSQTHKMDIWSLFVAIAVILNVAELRTQFRNPNLIGNPKSQIEAIQEAARHSSLLPLKMMAIVDAGQRASAGEMLDQLFHGEGRTTPRGRHHPATPQLNLTICHPDSSRLSQAEGWGSAMLMD
ncbi:STE protein kinase [Coccidioides immitis RS]|uniref:mitogen-activated protein kinase n=1 Tax=Coccidioides immitis (strain RS) TaxID=246410 RepID=J3KAE6_COCIM|nr:STE protein kinase [Coccidioides immitis RS]EAS31985.3 STE protein kinase [Coccidioides immitis RS]